MNLLHLSEILLAASLRAAELHAQAEEEAELRRQERESAKSELVAGDLDRLLSLVAERPGLSTGEVLAALQVQGLSLPRAKAALDASTGAGRTETYREGARTLHRLSGAEEGEE